jgi:hypothetical protein
MLTHEQRLKKYLRSNGRVTHRTACVFLYDTHVHRTIKALEADGWKFKRVKQYIKDSKRFYFIYTLIKIGNSHV